ncbi:MAG: Ig-like domain-containing protein [Christensenellaceae bacterium]|nr:Ig-like domain-containing protein [Christensenellaceae bacterium]
MDKLVLRWVSLCYLFGLLCLAPVCVRADLAPLTLCLGRASKPAGFEGPGLRYMSDDVNVARVDDAGYVTPVGLGEARISARAPDGTVEERAVRVFRFSSRLGEVTLSSRGTFDWAAQLDFAGPDPDALRFEGAGVDGNGVIHADRCTPEAELPRACVGDYYLEMYVTVIDFAPETHVIELDLGESGRAAAPLKLEIGSEYLDEAYGAIITAGALDRSVARVSGAAPDCVVEAVGEGETEVVVRLRVPDERIDLSERVPVRVARSGPSLCLNRARLTLSEGEQFRFRASLEGAPAEGGVQFRAVDAQDVLRVAPDGLATALEPGEALVVAEAEADGRTHRAECAVRVERAPTELRARVPAPSMRVGGAQMIEIAADTSVDARSLIFLSDQASVARVDAAGMIRALSPGAARIAVHWPRYALSAHVDVRVEAASVPLTALALSGPEELVAGGGAVQMELARLPRNADEAVIWRSLCPGVATVDERGCVTPIAQGYAVITACGAGGTVRARRLLAVREQPATACALEFSPNVIELEIGESADLAPLCRTVPAGAQAKAAFFVADGALALDRTRVTALAPGAHRVRAHCPDDESLEGTLTVLVDPPAASAVTLDIGAGTSLGLGGAPLSWRAEVLPAGAEQAVTWSSSDPAVAHVAGGCIWGLRPGAAVIRATAADGVYAERAVTVEAPDDRPRLLLSRTGLRAGDELILAHAGAGAEAVYFLDGAPLPGDRTGPLEPGEHRVEVRARGLADARTIEVRPWARALNLEPIEDSLPVGAERQLRAAFEPEGADEALIWSSSDARVLSVDQAGTARALGAGRAVVTARAPRAGLTASLTLTASVPAERVWLPERLQVARDAGEVELEPVALPAGAALPEGIWQYFDEGNWRGLPGADGHRLPIGALSWTPGGTLGVRYHVEGLEEVEPGWCTLVRTTASVTALKVEGAPDGGALRLALGEPERRLALSASSGGALFSAAGRDVQIHTEGTAADISYDKEAGALVVRASKPGVQMVRLSCEGAVLALSIAVEAHATGIALPEAAALALGEALVLEPVFTPEHHTDALEISYEVEGGAVEERSGVLYAVGLGETRVVARAGTLASAPMALTVRPPAGALRLDAAILPVAVGAAEQIHADLLPESARGTVYWDSDSERVATVDGDGRVRAHAPGEATVSARLEDGARETVRVIAFAAPSGFVDGNGPVDRVDLVAGGPPATLTLRALPSPVRATLDNAAAALCDARLSIEGSDCVLTLTPRADLSGAARSSGTVAVTVGGRAYRVAVCARSPVSAVELCCDEALPMRVGETRKLSARLLPERNTGARLTFAVDEPSRFVLSIDPLSGEVTAIAPGRGTVCARADEAPMAQITLLVEEGPFNLKLTDEAGVALPDRRTVFLDDGGFQLKAEHRPADAPAPELIFESDDPAVAGVSNDGTVRPHAPGEAVISVRAATDGRMSDAVRLTVVRRASGLSLAADAQVVKPGQPAALRVAIEPPGAIGGEVRYRAEGAGAALIELTSEGAVRLKPGVPRDGRMYPLDVVAHAGALADRLTLSVDLKNHVAITAQPQNLSATEGAIDAALRVAARVEQGEPRYQWHRAGGEAIAGATGPEYRLPTGLAAGSHGFFCRVSAEHADAVDSETAVVEVARPEPTPNPEPTPEPTPNPTTVTGIALDRAAASVGVGGVLRLRAFVEPENAVNRAVSWRSDAPNVASVDERGAVTGLSDGVARIRATTGDGGFEAECRIIVEYVPIDGLVPVGQPGALKPGEQARLACVWTPEHASRPALTWTSERPEVATVDPEGLVTGATPGETEVVARDAGTPFSARFGIAVEGEPEPTPKPPDKRPPGLQLPVLAVAKGKAMALPKLKGYRGTWTVQDASVARIKGASVVALRPGETELRFTVAEALAKAVELNDRRLEPGETYAVKFAVRGKGELAGKISADVKKLALDLTERPSHALVIRVKPVGVEAELFFVSNRPEVATVDDKGVIRAVAPGKATVYAYTSNLKRAEVKVTVAGLATRIEITDRTGKPLKKARVKPGDTLFLQALIDADALSEAVEWTSSRPLVASIDEHGLVTARKKGKTTIRVRALDGGKAKAKLALTVR